MSTYTTDPKQVTIDTLRARIAALEAFVREFDTTVTWHRYTDTIYLKLKAARDAVGQEVTTQHTYYIGDIVRDEDGNSGVVVIRWDDGDICYLENDAAHPNPEVVGHWEFGKKK